MSAFTSIFSTGARSILQRLSEQSAFTLVGLGLSVVAILLNAKNLPFAYHARIFYALYTHRRPLTSTQKSSGALFHPIVDKTGTPITECDYNVHKSNSTFFSDLDLSRIHLLSRLGLLKLSSKVPRPMLGGVATNFLRPVAPLEKVVTYTRILAWDEKWVYIASWMVPDRKVKEGKEAPVFATSVARYVCKLGRKTVPPAEVFEKAGLLPVKGEKGGKGEWSWEKAEEMRVKGLETAKLMGQMDSLKGDLQRSPNLGVF